MGTPLAVALVLLAILLGAGFAFDGGGEARETVRAPAPDVPAIAHRVEQLRGLRFKQLPAPQQVTPAQASREGLEDLDRSYPPARRHADEEVLKLLGLLEPAVDLRKVTASVFGQGVAGYYDPRSKRLRIVEGAQTANRVLNEITLAHELNHALEDQRFGLGLDDSSGTDDAALARLALVEGTATAVMVEYAKRHFSAEQTLGGLLSSLGQDTGDLPPLPGGPAAVPLHRGPGVRGAPLHARRGRLDGGQRGPALPPAGLDRAGAAPGRLRARAAAAARADRRAARPRRRLAAARGRHLGRVGDVRAARRRGRRRGLGRRRLRAVAARPAAPAPRPAAGATR